MKPLYINEEHCTSLEQLRSYFEDSPSYGSPLFYDLLDYARPGDISLWLREKGETILADQIDGIDLGLGDKDYFSRLSALMTGNNTSSDSIEKPDFSSCFHVEDVHQEKTSEGMNIHVRLKVLSSVNESYKFSVRTSWGQRVDTINPYHEEKDGMLTKSFSFPKRPNIKFKDITLLADGRNVAFKNVALLADGRELKDVQSVGIQLSVLGVLQQLADGLELKDVQSTGIGGEELELEVNSCRFKMIRVEHGSFMMGATEEMEYCHDNEKPVHKVTLTKDYYIGETQVTQALWKAVMGCNPSYYKGDNRPVERVSWNDCQEFIQRLNKKTGKKFRLPTEAEWEYAARGGNKSQHTQYSGSHNINDVAWYADNSMRKTHSVKGKCPNELSIYDMNGNVFEWCHDWFGPYNNNKQTNPQGPDSGTNRIVRGGNIVAHALGCRTSSRVMWSPIVPARILGFRLVLSE